MNIKLFEHFLQTFSECHLSESIVILLEVHLGSMCYLADRESQLDFLCHLLPDGVHQVIATALVIQAMKVGFGPDLLGKAAFIDCISPCVGFNHHDGSPQR